MSDKNNYSKLENLFRNRLSNSKPDNNGWNVPPPGLLDNALAQIPATTPKKRRFLGLWFFGAFALITLGFSIGYNLSWEDTQSVAIDTLRHTKEESAKTPIDRQLKETEKPSASKSVLPIAKVQSSNFENAESNEAEKTIKKSFENQHSRSQSDSQIVLFDNALQNPIGLESQTLYAQSYTAQQATQSSSNLIPQLYILNKLQAGVHNSKNTVSIPISNVEQIGPQSSPKLKNSIVFLNGGTNISSLRMTNMGSAEQTLSEYNLGQTGFQISAGYANIINTNLTVYGQIGFSRVCNHSVDNHNMEYQKDNESINNDGTLVYRSTLDFGSPMGTMTHQDDLPIGNMTIENNAILTQKTETAQLFNIYTAALGSEYRILTVGQIDLKLFGEIGLNYIHRLHNVVHAQVDYEGTMLMDKNVPMETKIESKSLFTTTTLGLAVSKSIGDKFVLSAKTGAYTSLTSLKKTQGTNGTKTYISGIQTDLSFGYKF